LLIVIGCGISLNLDAVAFRLGLIAVLEADDLAY